MPGRLGANTFLSRGRSFSFNLLIRLFLFSTRCAISIICDRPIGFAINTSACVSSSNPSMKTPSKVSSLTFFKEADMISNFSLNSATVPVCLIARNRWNRVPYWVSQNLSSNRCFNSVQLRMDRLPSSYWNHDKALPSIHTPLSASVNLFMPKYLSA